MQHDVKIFSGSSNLNLSNKICEVLGLGLSDLEINHFKDGEISVFVGDDVRNCHCFMIQSLCTPVNDNIMEFLVSVDAIHRSHASKITAVIPYMGYSRQDRRCRSGEPITAKLVSKLISMSGVDDVIIVDLHATQIEGFFDIPISHVSNFENFANDIKNISGFSPDNFVIVAPDVGAAKKTRKFASFLGCDMAIIDKHRSRANNSEVMNIIGDVSSKNVILIDDIIDTAGTISNAAEALVKIGNAMDVYIYATHAVCSGSAFEKLSNSHIKEVIFSDSIPLGRMNDNMRIVSLANVLAESINRSII